MESEPIFISYRWQDNPDDKYFDSFVRSVEEITGLNAAWDKEFLGSGNFKHAIAGKVASCIVFMPIVTEQYLAFGTLGGRENDNDYCLFELAKAIVEGRKIVPILSHRGGNIQTPSEAEAMSAAERVLSASCTDDDLRILQKHLLAQNGVSIDPQYETREDQLREKRESLSALIFDTFCKSGDIPYYKQFLERQAERLNPVRILGDYSSEGLTLENSYVPKTFQRHLTEEERNEKENRRESAAPSDIDENGLLEKLASERFSVITGDAGQGKSSFARHACIRLAKSAAQNGLSKDALFPLYFECKGIKSESLNRPADFLNELAEDSRLPRPAIEALLRHGRALFIFDAMDEVSPSQMDRLLEAIHSHLVLEKEWSFRILFTTRPGQKLVSGGGDMTIDHSQSTVVRRYSVKPFDERQRDEYVRKLAPALRADEGVSEAFLAAVKQKEKELRDYKTVSRNPFMLFAVFSTFISCAKLPETRFDAIVSVMDNMIERDMQKNGCANIDVEDVKTVLGAAAYRLYRERDEGMRSQAEKAALIEKATELYRLDKTDSDDRKLINEYKTLFGAGGLFDESGFRHEFLAATYAAYYLLFLMKRRTKGGNSPIDETEAAALRSGTDYWNSVTEALLCLLDSTSEDSKTYLEPLLEELQNADTPEYDTLCGAVSQFRRHRARAASALLSGMLERGCDGIESGSPNNGKFICKKGANPYEELFYYPAVYPALREFLPNLSTDGGSAEREYLRGELKKEVCALFSENEWECLQKRLCCPRGQRVSGIGTKDGEGRV